MTGVFGSVARFVRNVFDHREVWRNPSAPEPPHDPHGLKVASYNILLGGRYLDQAEAALRELDADVVCLQEASYESARRLGERLGYHVAWAGTALNTSGRAILSRYPIGAIEDRDYRSVSLRERLGAYWRLSASKGDWRSTEPASKRGLLRATIQVGGRTVDVLDTHLSLEDSRSNASQLEELAAYAGELARRGHTVVAAGDFNINFGLAGGSGQSDPAGTPRTPTDTVAEFRARYPRSILGNIGTFEGRAAADRFVGSLQSFWAAAPDRRVKVGAETLTPEQALSELAGGRHRPGTARYLELMRAADGISHIGASKRFDNVFVSGDARVVAAYIDQESRGSDHQPVMATIAWD